MSECRLRPVLEIVSLDGSTRAILPDGSIECDTQVSITISMAAFTAKMVETEGE